MRTHAKHRTSAFSGAELAAVLTVTAIVVTLGYSGYVTLSVRAQIAEDIATARGLAPYLAQAFRRTREIPSDETLSAAATAVADGARRIARVSVDSGRIDIVFGEAADPAIAGRAISLTPFETATLDIVWLCGNAIPSLGLKPLGFSGGGKQAIQRATTIEARYLPTECR